MTSPSEQVVVRLREAVRDDVTRETREWRGLVAEVRGCARHAAVDASGREGEQAPATAVGRKRKEGSAREQESKWWEMLVLNSDSTKY